ncbi:uncharacterized protein LTR77_003850 [Saxophila tyrrhenica]|uniref:NAD(P)-binding domain-containing protein n=1 Tax=Saxophila tyrrhenica TaxID=1690608 RepID=A0AAV9PIU7_9PEZI|nr:hypothetical protein LTR77_003850 [Saxophila tyrrhenica]
MLAIVGASGKLGFATLTSLLNENLLPASQIVVTSSSDSGTQKLRSLNQPDLQIRSAHWDDPSSFESALAGCDKLFLISSSRIQKDFFDAPPGKGREADHFVALEAAKKVGVKHVYYTSLGFAKPSQSRVMKAHERTEDWLAQQSGLKWTVLREGLYNESWLLYFGHYGFPGDEREVVKVGGDSKISWTAIGDLGLASAMVIAAPGEEWEGKTFYLSQKKAHTLEEVAGMVSRARGKEVRLEVVERPEHERVYVEDRGMDEGFIKWWAKTYDALRDNECEISDPTLEDLLAKKGLKPKAMEDTVKDMLAAAK